MIKLRVEELLPAVQGKLVNAPEFLKREISGVSTDSRVIQAGNLFVALKGEFYDGHDFILNAWQKKAACILVKDKKVKEISQALLEDMPVVAVGDTLKALGSLAFWYRRKFDIPVIAVSGSNGKTTTKDMIYEVISTQNQVLKSEGNLNNQIGLPLSIFNLNPSHKFAVFELAMSKAGELTYLTLISSPTVGIITNIGPAHLEFFGTMEKIAKAKFELLEAMASDSVAVLNADDKFLALRAQKEKRKVITFGIEKKADYQAFQISLNGSGHIDYLVNNIFKLHLTLLGKNNIYNSLIAWAVGEYFGIPAQKIASALENFRPVGWRMELLDLEQIKIINDVYNANPSSTVYAVEALCQMRTSGRKIAVLGDMLELGEKSRKLHQETGKKVAKLRPDFLITIGKKARDVALTALKNHYPEEQTKIFVDKKEALPFLQDFIKHGDILLIKGSRALKLEELVLSLKQTFTRQN